MITRSLRQQSLLNAYWIPLNVQNSAILAIAVPAALLRIPGINHTAVLAILASTIGGLSLLVPPIAGAISDQLRRRGGQRRPVLLLGAAVNVIGLFWMSRVTAIDPFAIALLVAVVGQSISLAAYQPLIPEVVARSEWGLASGYQGIASLVGSVAGLAIASVTDPATTFLWCAAIVIAGALMVSATPEGRFVEGEDHARVGNWYDFAVAFTSRFFTNFGLMLLSTYVLFYFHDVLKSENPSAGTGFFGGLSLVGAIATSLWMGHLSDRVSRKVVVALAGIPMSLAILTFALVPSMRWIAVIALLFGLGYGAIVSTGWALAIDSVPRLRDVARDLGIWGVAAGLPGMLAPAFGGWLLAQYASPAVGYKALFLVAAGCFVLGSIIVLLIGSKSTRFGVCFMAFTMGTIYPYYWTAYRIRSWGRLPWRRGATLVLCNHQHDLDTTAGVIKITLGGPWNKPIYTAGSRRMFEPGFMAARLPWLRSHLRSANASKILTAIGLLPIENELRTRSLASLAWGVYARHGEVPLGSVFREDVLAKLDAQAATTTVGQLFGEKWFSAAGEMRVPLKAVLDPYRSEIFAETRANLEPDYQRLERALKEGNTVFLAPEGRYSRDGSMGSLRTALTRLEPLAETIYLVAISYDVFVGRRLSLLFRVVLPADPNDLDTSMKAARPVTVSQLLSAWLADSSYASFNFVEASEAVRSRLHSLPAGTFVDPELRESPERKVRAALVGMLRLEILVEQSGVLRLTSQRRHPQFPLVDDMVAFQARFSSETEQALQKLCQRNGAVEFTRP